jgi:8-amino-7-oxononanoate synthase
MIPIVTLESRLSVILDTWTKRGMPLQDLVEPAPSTDVDLFSCDYLSLSGNQDLRSLFLSRLAKEPRVMGYGSRLIDGNTSLHVSLEQQLAKFFKGPSSLVFNSGSDANSGMWSTLVRFKSLYSYKPPCLTILYAAAARGCCHIR